jgi:hypothetical protein
MSEPAAQKKGLSGCAIAAIVVAVVFAVGLVGMIAGGVWFFNRSEVGMAVRDTITAASQAKTAPGTSEMRAAGCATASSIDFSRMADAAKSMARDPRGKAEAERMAGTFAVNCVSPSLTCGQVAAAWGQGAPPNARSAIVTVWDAPNDSKARCSGHFDRTGAEIPNRSDTPAPTPPPNPDLEAH